MCSFKYVNNNHAPGQKCPRNGMGAHQRPPKGPRTPEMDPKWSTQLPLIGLSPFPGPLTRLGASRELRSQIEAISGADFDLP